MTTFADIAPGSRPWRSRCPRGPTATPAPGSRCSAARAPRGPSRRRSPTPRRCTGSPGSRRGGAAHPVGPGRRLRRAARVRRGPRRRARHDQHQHVPGRRLQARQPDPRRPGASARRRSSTTSTCIEVMDADRVARPEDLARRRHQLPRPGRHPRPPGLAGRGAGRRSTTRLGDDQRLVLEYKFFEPAFYHTDVPDWGTSYVHVRALGEQGGGLPRHRPPRAGHQHRVHRRPAAAAREARLVRLQQPLLRRRRPDRRRAPTRSSCSGSWSRWSAAAAYGPRQRRRAACSTSATTSRRRSPARSGRCSTCRR